MNIVQPKSLAGRALWMFIAGVLTTTVSRFQLGERKWMITDYEGGDKFR
jgi:hypothetical protein